MGGEGIYIACDQDPEALKFCKTRFKDKRQFKYLAKNYVDFSGFLDKNGLKLDKVLLDLGMSSFQLDHPERGFSFQGEAPLDMRMDPNNNQSAAHILNTYSIEKLSDMFYQYGELKHNKKLSQAIANFRKKHALKTTDQLVHLIKESYRFAGNRRFFIKTCSQVFQALRIEVNQELTVLETFLETLIPYLNSGARVAIITFHSLEDRIVKRFVKSQKYILEPLTKKVIKPGQDEIRQNSRASCAKLRVFRKV